MPQCKNDPNRANILSTLGNVDPYCKLQQNFRKKYSFKFITRFGISDNKALRLSAIITLLEFMAIIMNFSQTWYTNIANVLN